MSRQGDFKQASMDYCEDHSHCIYFEFGAEYGYQYARKNLWHDAQGDIVPKYDREVIVIGRDGKIFYGHRPNPEEATMVEGKPYHAKTYDKN